MNSAIFTFYGNSTGRECYDRFYSAEIENIFLHSHIPIWWVWTVSLFHLLTKSRNNKTIGGSPASDLSAGDPDQIIKYHHRPQSSPGLNMIAFQSGKKEVELAPMSYLLEGASPCKTCSRHVSVSWQIYDEMHLPNYVIRNVETCLHLNSKIKTQLWFIQI